MGLAISLSRRRPLAKPKKPIDSSVGKRELDIGFVNDPRAGTAQDATGNRYSCQESLIAARSPTKLQRHDLILGSTRGKCSLPRTLVVSSWALLSRYLSTIASQPSRYRTYKIVARSLRHRLRDTMIGTCLHQPRQRSSRELFHHIPRDSFIRQLAQAKARPSIGNHGSSLPVDLIALIAGIVVARTAEGGSGGCKGEDECSHCRCRR